MREICQEGEIVTRAKNKTLKIECTRHQDEAIEGDTLINQVTGKPGGASCTIALTNQEQWGGPAIVADRYIRINSPTDVISPRTA